MGKVFEEIMANCFSDFMNFKHTDARSKTNSRQDKHKEN